MQQPIPPDQTVSDVYLPASVPRRRAGWAVMWLAGSVAVGLVVIAVLAAGLVAVQPELASAHPALAELSGWWSTISPVRSHALLREAESLWASSNWGAAARALSELHELRPDDDEIRFKLGIAHFLYAQQLEKAGLLSEALENYERALNLTPDQPAVIRAYHLVNEYVTGRALHSEGDWAGAIRHLDVACGLEPDFRDCKRLLYSAHFQYGVHLQSKGQIERAKAEYEEALELWSNGPEARISLAEVEVLLNPPPTKLIVVSITKQRMYMFENGKLIHDWLCSTGEPGRDTRPGKYKILSKMETAYASVWNLDMPFWMGVYYAGGSENGIHAPPIQRETGQKMWEGLLGQRVSYGCIIISESNAKILFTWSEVGTPVEVVI